MPRCLSPQVRAYDACGNETLDELLVAAQLRYVTEVIKVSSDPNVNSALTHATLSGAGGAGGGGGGGGGGFVPAPPPPPRVHVGAPRPPGTVPR